MCALSQQVVKKFRDDQMAIVIGTDRDFALGLGTGVPRVRFQFAPDLSEVRRLARLALNPCFFIDAASSSANRTLDLALRACHEFPHSAAILILDREAFGNFDFAAAAEIKADGAFYRHEIDPAGLHESLESVASRVPDLLVRELHNCLERRLADLIVSCLGLAFERMTVTSFAEARSVVARSLRRRLQQFGLPSPQAVVRATRLCVAAFYLEEPGRSVASIASLLGFSSELALRAQLVRFAHQPISELRAPGASQYVMQAAAAAFEQSLARRHRS